jgi:hypothetical protein
MGIDFFNPAVRSRIFMDRVMPMVSMAVMDFLVKERYSTAPIKFVS